MEKINIWELDRVHIKLKLKFIDNLNAKIFEKFKTKPKAYKQIFRNDEIQFITFKNILKKSYMDNFFVPLKIYLKIIEFCDIPKEVLQDNIFAYKTAGGINFIECPILPIKITPIFDMILAHNISDGTVINSGKGRLPYFGYRQFDKHYRKLYVKKIESVFGKIKFKKNYFNESTRPYCPPVLSSLFFKYYNLNVNSFLSRSARIPRKVFDNGKDNLLTILIAFIIDEGNIDSTQITIALKNKLLVSDLKKICDFLGYESKITYRLGEYEGYGYLNILRNGMKMFYNDYLKMFKKYPVIDLGRKGKQIEDSFKIFSRKIQRIKGNKELMLNILKKEQLSVNQLAMLVNMTRQGVRYHIHNLLKENKIKIINKNDPNWLYGV